MSNQAGSTSPASNVQSVHQLFRGSAEVTKIIRQFALCLELVAAMIAASSTMNDGALWGGWASLVILILMSASTVLRIWSRSTQGFSERCRRVSARAFALGEKVGAAVFSSLVSDAPLFAESTASKLPASSLIDYYEPTKPEGQARLREIWAHSAFYSWRLQRRTGWALIGVGVLVAIVGAAVIYGLAVQPREASISGRILDVVCSLVFVVLAAKALDSGAAGIAAGREARAVADGLLETSDPGRLDELVAEYDIERASGPSVPTLIYRLSRDELQRQWHERRKALDDL